MIRFWFIPVMGLTLILALPIFMIRAQPYDDRVTQEFSPEDCPAPCLMGIRPGEHSLSEGVYFLEAHDWVATRVNQMPSVVQMSVRYGAPIPITDVNWRWNPDPPAWINPSEHGVITVENLGVKMMTVDTFLTVGEVKLAFGDPDAIWLTDRRNHRFEYSAWYANQQMYVTAEGLCPPRNAVHFPVRIRLYATPPRLTEPETNACD